MRIAVCGCVAGIASFYFAPQTPVEATLTVRVANARSTFAIGERIPLELVFSGRADPDYSFTTANYDRSGRLSYEDYRVSPADAVEDPLRELYATRTVISGGLSSRHALDGKPFVLRVDLNEWVRFRRPGTFTLTVMSQRLLRDSRSAAPTVASGPVTIEISAANSEWIAAEVDRALAAIDSSQPDRIRDGAKILRYLDTRESTSALVARYDLIVRHANFDIYAGLFSASDRQFVIEAMQRHLDTGQVRDAGFHQLLDAIKARPRSGRALVTPDGARAPD